MNGRIDRFFASPYNPLLLALFLIFISRPISDNQIYFAAWRSLLTLIFVGSIFTSRPARPLQFFCCGLGLFAIALTWINLDFYSDEIFIANVLATIALQVFSTGSIIKTVIKQYATNQLEVLKGVVAAYLMLAFLFAYIFYLNEFISPGSFRFIEGSADFTFYHIPYLAELVYFSFITFLTVGYGDITPLTGISQTVSVLEGIIGQFYIALLVSQIIVLVNKKK